MKATQLVLTFISVCAVADASRIERPLDRPGLFAGIPLNNAAYRDRRLSDLARLERRRREATQQSVRSGIERSVGGGAVTS